MSWQNNDNKTKLTKSVSSSTQHHKSFLKKKNDCYINYYFMIFNDNVERR